MNTKTLLIKGASALTALGILGTSAFVTVSAQNNPNTNAGNGNPSASNQQQGQFGPGNGQWQKPGQNHGPKDIWPLLGDAKLTSTIAYQDNGVVLTLTTDDTTRVGQLQKMAAMLKNNQMFKDRGITVTVENLTNGIKVTLTATDAETIENLKLHGEREELLKKLRSENVDIKEQTNREAVNVDNGVQITITSDNADVARLIQIQEQLKPKEDTMGPGNGGQGGPHQGQNGQFPGGQGNPGFYQDAQGATAPTEGAAQ